MNTNEPATAPLTAEQERALILAESVLDGGCLSWTMERLHDLRRELERHQGLPRVATALRIFKGERIGKETTPTDAQVALVFAEHVLVAGPMKFTAEQIKDAIWYLWVFDYLPKVAEAIRILEAKAK